MSTTPVLQARRRLRQRTLAALLATAIAAAGAPSAFARGGHGGGHGGRFGGQGLHLGHRGGGGFAGGERKANDKYVHAASDELDKLLNRRMKNICRGC